MAEATKSGWTRLTTVTFVTTLATVLVAIHVAGQTQSQVFRSRIDLVRTDVSVIDNKTGRPLTGLTAADFTVTENGVRQTISHFVAETGESLGGGAPLGDGQGAGPVGRTFLIILGVGNAEGTSDPYGGVTRFIRQRLRPTDRAAIMVWDMVTPFTSDFEALARLVERRRRIPTDVFTSMQVDGQNREDISQKSRAAISRWLFPEGEHTNFLRPVAPLVLGTPEAAQDRLIWQRLNSHIASSDLLKVAGGIELLRAHTGEKRLILVSYLGLAIPFQLRNYVMVRSNEDAVGLAFRAADAGVILDLINTYGTKPGLDYALAILGAQRIASETGGEFGSVRTVDQQLSRVDESSRYGYVIGYLPTNQVQDGKRRHVSIAVARKDVTVIYRRGYAASPGLPPVDMREHLTRVRIQDAAAAAADIQIRVGGTRTTGSGSEQQLVVEMTIDPTRLSLAERDGKRHGTIDLTILCADDQHKTVGILEQRMTLTLDETKYQQALKSGIPYTAQVPVKARPVHAKIIVYSFDNDRLGSVSLRVR